MIRERFLMRSAVETKACLLALAAGLLVLGATLMFVPASAFAQGQFWMPEPEGSQRVDSNESGIPFLVDESESHRLELMFLRSGQFCAVRVSIENKTAEPLLVKAGDLKVSTGASDKSEVSYSGEIPLMSPEQVAAVYDRARLPLIDDTAKSVAIPPGPPPVLFGSGFGQGYIAGLYLKQQRDYQAALQSGANADAFNARARELNEQRQRINDLIAALKAGESGSELWSTVKGGSWAVSGWSNAWVGRAIADELIRFLNSIEKGERK
jgi:hypothetical protein